MVELLLSVAVTIMTDYIGPWVVSLKDCCWIKRFIAAGTSYERELGVFCL
jgi:hypothetical protein